MTSIRDMVRADRALLEYLGVRRLPMVYGVLMDGFQSAEWAVTFPDLTEILSLGSSP